MDEQARLRIDQNREARDEHLDLGGLALGDIPPELSDFGWLKSLDLSGTGIADLQTLSGLQGLQRLTIERTRVTSLSPLSNLTELADLRAGGSKITNCQALAGLPQLRRLGLWGTSLTDLSPLAELASLRQLIIWRTAVQDLAPLRDLVGLEDLDIDQTEVRSLDALAGLGALNVLHVSRTKVTDLSPLSGLDRLVRLHLNNTQVTTLASIAQLKQLQFLSADYCKLLDITSLRGMAALLELSLNGLPLTHVQGLAGVRTLSSLDLAYSQVSDIGALAQLGDLGYLNLGNTQVRSLGPLAGLPALHGLNLTSMPWLDLAPLGTLPALRSLTILGAGQDQLNQIGGLQKLEQLNIEARGLPAPTETSPAGAGLPLWRRMRGQVAAWWRSTLGTEAPVQAPPAPQAAASLSIVALAGLIDLKTVSLAGQPVTDLSPLRALIEAGAEVKVKTHMWQGPGILIEGCPLSIPPLEVVHQGRDAILNYFNERDAGVDHLYEAKLLILGEGGAGKTSLVRRLYQPGTSLPAENETTRGIAIHRHDFKLPDGRPFRLNVWDFGGQEIYHATHQFFLTRRSLYVLLDDTRKDHKSVSDEGFKYWLDLVDVFGGRSPVLIFQNEKDGRSKEIDLAGIKGRFDNVQDRYAGDLAQAGAADRLRQAIEWHASHLGHIGEELPARWVSLRARIEQVAQDKPYITRQAYFDLYAQQMPFDRKKALHLSRYLHDLGVFLHFQGDDPDDDDNVLARSVILRNTWATEAVFRILDDETVKARRGRFTRADCQRIWHDPAYTDMHPELLALMQRFELCYELADSKPATWLAPQLLSASKPAALDGWAQADDLVLRFQYDFMPKGLISRLTVRLHRLVLDADKAWVTGVLLESEKAQVLVQRLPQGGEIELRARGADRKALMSVAAAELDALNQSFAGLSSKVDKRTPCVCSDCKGGTAPAFFGHRSLLKRREDRRWQVECPVSYEPVSVLELLDGISSNDLGSRSASHKGGGAPHAIKIFLASSSELAEDRDAFELHFRQRNDDLIKSGVVLQIVRWEHFLDALSPTRLQDEYNAAARQCDVFVSLYFRKTGTFTEEEFNAAFSQFKATGKPSLFTYFKDAPVNMASVGDEVRTLLDFKARLKALGHYPSHYTSTSDLHLQFRDQLLRLGITDLAL